MGIDSVTKSTEEAAAALGLGYGYLRRLLAEGQIVGPRVISRNGNRRRWTQEDIESARQQLGTINVLSKSLAIKALQFSERMARFIEGLDPKQKTEEALSILSGYSEFRKEVSKLRSDMPKSRPSHVFE